MEIDILFTLLSTILGGWAGFLFTKGSLTDNRLKGHKRITRRGRITFFVILLNGACIVTQNYYIKQEDIKKENRRITQIRNDRIALFSDLSKALGKHYIKFDTVTNELKRLQSQPKTVIVNSPVKKPMFTIYSSGIQIELKNDTLNYTIEASFVEATAIDVSIFCTIDILMEDSTSFFAKDLNLTQGNISFPQDQRRGFIRHLQKVRGEIKNIHFAFYGKYFTVNEKKPIKLRKLYRYDHKEKRTVELGSEDLNIFYKRLGVENS